IIFPLFTVLKSAVFVNGRFDFSVLAATLKHPLFFVLDSTFTERNELNLALRWTVGGAVFGALSGLLGRRSALASGGRILLGAAIGFVIGIMLYGNGALPTSLAVVCIAAPACTLLGLVFALLGQRSRLAGVRRSLDVLSILPII